MKITYSSFDYYYYYCYRQEMGLPNAMLSQMVLVQVWQRVPTQKEKFTNLSTKKKH
jgi:hypothetical protein